MVEATIEYDIVQLSARYFFIRTCKKRRQYFVY